MFIRRAVGAVLSNICVMKDRNTIQSIRLWKDMHFCANKTIGSFTVNEKVNCVKLQPKLNKP